MAITVVYAGTPKSAGSVSVTDSSITALSVDDALFVEAHTNSTAPSISNGGTGTITWTVNYSSLSGDTSAAGWYGRVTGAGTPTVTITPASSERCEMVVTVLRGVDWSGSPIEQFAGDFTAGYTTDHTKAAAGSVPAGDAVLAHSFVNGGVGTMTAGASAPNSNFAEQHANSMNMARELSASWAGGTPTAHFTNTDSERHFNTIYGVKAAGATSTAPNRMPEGLLTGQKTPGIQTQTLVRLVASKQPVFGTSAQALGSVTSNAYGQVAPQDVAQQVVTAAPVPGVQLPILGPPFFASPRPPVSGFAQDALGSVTSNAYGQVAPQRMPTAELVAQTVQGVQLPVLGPPLFASRAPSTVTGSIAATLDAFTSAISAGHGPNGTIADTLDAFTTALVGNVGRPAQAYTATLLDPPVPLQLPIIGPAFFAQRPSTVTGTVAAVLGSVTSDASGATTPPANPRLQAILLRPPPGGLQLPTRIRVNPVTGTSNTTLGSCTSTGTGGHGPDGTAADTLDAFTSSATGGVGAAGTVAVTLANLIADASGSTVVGTVAAVLAAFTCTATGVVGTLEDPFALTLTVRDRGHTATLVSAGHTSTIRDHGHTATLEDQGHTSTGRERSSLHGREQQ